MFRPSSRQKQHMMSQMTTMPLSPKQPQTLPSSVSTKTITLTSMKPATSENATPVGKNIQRIRLKKRSEATITPLSLACSKLNME